jgi:hypothetical protein
MNNNSKKFMSFDVKHETRRHLENAQDKIFQI